MHRKLSVVLAVVVLAGCNATTGTTPPPAPSGVTPATASPIASSSVSPSPLASPAASAAPTPAPSPSSSAALHGWVERASFPGESLDVLLPGGPGLIAAGSRESTGAGDPGDALVRLSADGSTWRQAVVEGSSGGSIHAIRRLNGTYVALGTRNMGDLDLRGVVWTSPDTERWALVATFPLLVPQDIVEADGHLLAWGTGGWTEPHGLFVWTLADVGRWGTARQIDAFDEAFLAHGVIGTTRGFLVFGNRGRVIPAMAARIFVATSADGLTWRFAPAQPSLERAAFEAVVERPDGYLAVGWALAADGSGVAAVWRSVDGLTWDRTLDTSGLTGGRLVRATVSDDRFLVRGTIDAGKTTRAVSWESLDGVHWTLLPLGADIPDLTGTMPSDPVAFGGTRVAVATVDDGSSSTRAVVFVEGSVLP